MQIQIKVWKTSYKSEFQYKEELESEAWKSNSNKDLETKLSFNSGANAIL